MPMAVYLRRDITGTKIKRILQKSMRFSVLEELNEILRRIGYAQKTEIQKSLLPLGVKMDSRRDIVGLAETGTGKTACFVVPIVEDIADDPFGVHSLILTPTRELCHQTKEQVDVMGDYFGVRCTVVHGGDELHRQSAAIQKRPHVLISTPGRLKALLSTEKTRACFRRVRAVVLDEADLLMNSSQAPAVHFILQTILGMAEPRLFFFSATDVCPRAPVKEKGEEDKQDNAEKENTDKACDNAGSVLESTACPGLWRLFRSRSVLLVDARKGLAPKRIIQEYARVHANAKEAHLIDLLREEYAGEHVIVFMNRSRESCVLAEILQDLGINAASLCRGMERKKRYDAFTSFRAGKISVLLTTDVASRGIDARHVTQVINYDLPNSATDYIHRIGRTGRMGAEGHALSFVSSGDLEILKHIKATLAGTSEITEKKLRPLATPRLLNIVSAKKEFILHGKKNMRKDP